MENLKINRRELYEILRICWFASKKFYEGKTDDYFFTFYDNISKEIREIEPVVVWIERHKISSRLRKTILNVAIEDLSFRKSMLYVSDIEKEAFLNFRGSSITQWEEFVKYRGY